MKFRFCLLLSLCLNSLFAQQADTDLRSYFGGVHTPKGHLHLLVVFVRYADTSLMADDDRWPNDDLLPAMARGEDNRLFLSDPAALQAGRSRTLTDFYHAMSGGEFTLTADIYPQQVPVAFRAAPDRKYPGSPFLLNQRAVHWIAENDPDFDWSRYDRRTNHPNYRFDNQDSDPDSVLDFVVFFHRKPGSSGLGAVGNTPIPGTPYRVGTGYTSVHSYSDDKHTWEMFTHEFAHNLYDCPHYLGANRADGNRYYTQKGWGMMAAWHAPFFTSNAWENWWLGWLEPQNVTRNGRYRLRDFVTAQDAIRIPLPGTEDVLWLENHQKKDPWDRKLFFSNVENGYTESDPGLYLYTVGAPGAKREQPKLNPFNQGQVNFIRTYHAAGNFDYAATGDSLQTEYLLAPIFVRGQPNPIAGQNPFAYLRADLDGNQRIQVGYGHGNRDGGGEEQYELWAGIDDSGEPVYTVAHTGAEGDALQVGDRVGLSGRFPLLNFPTYDRQAQQLEPYRLNGVSITVAEQDAEGTLWLDIRLDDWTVTGQQRWCGPILLPEQNDAPPLLLAEDGEILLDLSGTPDRERLHPKTGSLVNPTYLDVAPGREIRLQKGSRLVVQDHSELILRAGSRLVVERGAELLVTDNGRLRLEAGATLKLEKGATGTIDFDGFLQDESRGTGLVLEKGSQWTDR